MDETEAPHLDLEQLSGAHVVVGDVLISAAMQSDSPGSATILALGRLSD
jgi:hypothetical protein